MTYHQKYLELFGALEAATDELYKQTSTISFKDGFGQLEPLEGYYESKTKYNYAEKQFSRLLKYLNADGVNGDSEFVEWRYMYEHIKKDQRSQGKGWGEDQIRPEIKVNGVTAVFCTIGLTNDGSEAPPFQETEYKFPVVNLQHGKECYVELCKYLQAAPNEFNIDELKFEKVSQEHQIYVSVNLRIDPM